MFVNLLEILNVVKKKNSAFFGVFKSNLLNVIEYDRLLINPFHSYPHLKLF